MLLRATCAQAAADLAGDYRLTRSELGEMANASRDLVNRTLNRLAQEGMVEVGYGRIAIRDPARLEAFVRGEAA